MTKTVEYKLNAVPESCASLERMSNLLDETVDLDVLVGHKSKKQLMLDTLKAPETYVSGALCSVISLSASTIVSAIVLGAIGLSPSDDPGKGLAFFVASFSAVVGFAVAVLIGYKDDVNEAQKESANNLKKYDRTAVLKFVNDYPKVRVLLNSYSDLVTEHGKDTTEFRWRAAILEDEYAVLKRSIKASAANRHRAEKKRYADSVRRAVNSNGVVGIVIEDNDGDEPIQDRVVATDSDLVEDTSDCRLPF